MVTYFTKQFQAVPALMAICKRVGGCFVSTRTNTIKAIRENNPQVSIANYVEKLGHFSQGYKTMEGAALIVTGGPYRQLLSRFQARKYMIFTGTTPALTVKEISDDHAHFSKLCAIGPRMFRVIEKSGIQVPAEITGYFPFLGFPEKSADTARRLLQSVGLDADRETIVYLPRGEPNGSFDLMMPKFLQEMPKTDFNFIIRPHPSQSVKLHLRNRWRFIKLQSQIGPQCNIFLDLNHFRLSDLLLIANLVITDGNSPAEESLFYDTPQILLETQRLSRASISASMGQQGASKEDIELALRIYDNGPIMTPDENNLIVALENALVESPKYAAARRDNFEFVFGQRDFGPQQHLIEELRSISS